MKPETKNGNGDVKTESTDLVTLKNGQQSFNMAALDKATQKKVNELTARLHKEIHAFGQAGLAIGKTLTEARELLKGKRNFNVWLQTYVVGFRTATAYRYMRQYENAQKMLPVATIERAMLTGMEIGSDKFKDAIAQVGEAPKDSEAANVWLDQVVQAYDRGRKAPKPEPSYEDIQRLTVVSFVRSVAKIGEAKRADWITSTLAFCLGELGFTKAITIKPRKAPQVISADVERKPGRPRQESSKGSQKAA